MSEWISVKDRLPEYEDTYLTFNISGYEMMLRVYYRKKKIFSNPFGNKYVTHWMSLPEPPK